MDGLNKMCVFYAVIKPALGNIIRRGGIMTEIEKLSEELADYNVPDELIGRIENLLANLYAEKERLRIERSWELYPDRMGK